MRLHWADQPYVWHVNDGPEIFAVIDGVVDMHCRDPTGERVEWLTPGRICVAGVSDEHVAYPGRAAHVLVVDRKGSL